MEDQQIVELFWQRSELAIAELENKYGKRAQQFAAQILDNAADAQECVNDAMHALWQQIPPQRPAYLWAYFSRVLRNLSLDRADRIHAAKRDRRCEIPLSELEGALPTGQDLQDMLEAKLLQERINSFLDSRTSTDRIIFVRRYYYFDSCQQIAKRLGLTRGAVNTRLSRLRKELKQQLEKEELLL